eukprot:jgi/Ulvmu1/2696/UM014_0152.1
MSTQQQLRGLLRSALKCSVRWGDVSGGLIGSAPAYTRSFHSAIFTNSTHALLRPASTLAGYRLALAGPVHDVQQSHSWQQYRSFRAQFPAVLGQDGKSRSTCDPVRPEDCDRIVEELRYRNIKVPRQLDISWRRRIQGGILSVYNAIRACVVFVFNIPGYLNTARKMSLSEWRQASSSTWATVKHEAHHYWVGFKLFGFELRVATRLIWKQLNGASLTRRERKQLTRTTADIFRVVPFTFFIIIPFAEVLLPVALRIFPNMLPSTFQTQLKQEEDMKKLLKLKTELARFLQQTVGELAKDVKRNRSGELAVDAKALSTFLKDVRGGRSVSNTDIVRFARLFSDELTLENLDRVHLVTLCQFLSLNAIGTEAFLRARLRTHLNELKADDREIKKEGLEQLTDDELRHACRARGMPAPFGRGCTALMQKQLRDWIELSLDRNIPQSLLLLSRAFKIQTAKVADAKKDRVKDSKEATVESLKDTFNMLPDDTLEDVTMETFKGAASLEKRLQYLQRVEKAIKEENAASEELQAAQDVEDTQSKLESAVEANARATAKAVVRKAAARAERHALALEAEEAGDAAHERQRLRDAHAKEERMGTLISSLVALASASGVSQERALFMEVANNAVQSELSKLSPPGGSYMEFDGRTGMLEVVRPSGEVQAADEMTESVSKSVNDMLIRIEGELDRADSQIGEKLHVLDQDNDGMISRQELICALALLDTHLSPSEMAALTALLGDDEKISVSKLEELGSRLEAHRDSLRSDA